MIISVSRRTDIPAFYSSWFFQELKNGSTETVNPFNARQRKTLSLQPQDVDCFVFWSRYPEPMLKRIKLLDPYTAYIMITITGYGKPLEPNMPSAEDQTACFSRFSDIWGPHRVIWRYDPIVLLPDMPVKYHTEQFRFIARRLEGKTERCIISFVDPYAKAERTMGRHGLKMRSPTEQETADIAGSFADIAASHGMRIQSCCELSSLSRFGVKPGACIDGNLIGELRNRKNHDLEGKNSREQLFGPSEMPSPAARTYPSRTYRKDRKQRPNCLCAESRDIGWYRSCRFGCLYCYAN